MVDVRVCQTPMRLDEPSEGEANHRQPCPSTNTLPETETQTHWYNVCPPDRPTLAHPYPLTPDATEPEAERPTAKGVIPFLRSSSIRSL